MTCFKCKGEIENKKTTYMIELNQCIIIIKNVPSLVCKQCGEVSYTDKVIDSVKNTITEITVINYTDKVA